MQSIQEIHEHAMICAKHFKRAEANLLDSLQHVDERKVFRALGYPSLFVYAVSALKLSESLAYQFIGVARKSKEVPELKAAVASGEITVSTARRVVSVITKNNQEDWLGKAKSLTQKSLEMEVAKVNPKETVKERIRPVAVERLEMRLGISPALDMKLARVKDLLSQKYQKPVSLEETVDALVNSFLERYDPIEKAERLLARTVGGKKALTHGPEPANKPTFRDVRGRHGKPSARTIHQVNLRDQKTCTQLDVHGVRCTQTRWTQIHHIKLVSQGGGHELPNLQTLCFHHHKKIHENDQHNCVD